MKMLLTVPLMMAAIVFSGCNAQQKAQDFEKPINGILQIAEAAYPGLPPADQAIVKPWINIGVTADNQLQTCIATLGTGGKSAQFATCFTAFAGIFTDPKQLALLRVMNPDSQSKAQLWATAAILAVNAAVKVFGGTSQPLPVIAEHQPSRQEIEAMARGLGIPAFAYGY